MVSIAADNQRVLLFGSHGQLGSRIRDRLELSGLCVIEPIYFPRMETSISARSLNIEDTLAQGGVSKIIHAASPNAQFALNNTELALDWAINRNSELARLLELLPDAGVIHLSTVQVYGESQAGHIDESRPLLGSHPYAEMHQKLETGLARVPYSTILRLGNVFGRAGRAGAISWNLVTHDLAKQFADCCQATVRSNANQARDFVPAARVVEVVARLVADQVEGVFNLTTGKSTTLRDWGAFIRNRAEIVLGNPCDIVFAGGDQPSRHFTIDSQLLDRVVPISSPKLEMMADEMDSLLEFANSKPWVADD